jgi:long-chain acyl-CoA synthetase
MSTRAEGAPGTATPKFAATPGDVAEGTIVELFFRAADEHDKDDAYLHKTPAGWEPVSHREVLEQVHAAAKGLRTLGIARGDRISILSENRLEWAITDFALMCSGAVSVPVYPTLPADQVATILQHAGTRFIFASSAEQYAKLLEIRAQLPELERIFTFDDVPNAAPDVVSFGTLLQRGRAEPGTETEFRLAAHAARPDDLLTLIYTSGTTGTPKGVMLTHNNLHSNVVASLPRFPIAAADVSLSFLTLSHVFQRMVDYATYSVGVTIAHLADIDQVARTFREVRPTLAVAVPRVYEKLHTRLLSEKGIRRRIVLWARAVALDWAERKLHGRPVPAGLSLKHSVADRLVYRKVRERLGGRLRFFISGGAPLNPQLAYFFYGVGIKILEGYGLTETSPVTNATPPEAIRVGTVGPPITGTEVRIAEDGEILVRGPQVMKGYYRNPEATREAVDAEGWFHTGDIGDLDGDGYLRITDRKKDLLVTAGGKNIAPQPIEGAVKTSRYIAEAVMLGDRRPYAILLVVPNFDQLEAWAVNQGIRFKDRAELAAHPRVRALLEEETARRTERFARFERPKKVLPLERELTLERQEITPSLKVKRRVVEKNFRDRIEALYEEPAPDEPAEPK